MITRRFYDALGGHDGHAEAEAAMLRKLGRRRIAMLPAQRRRADPFLPSGSILPRLHPWASASRRR